MKGNLYLDPGVALLRWLLVRGDRAGPLFPELTFVAGEKARINFKRPFDSTAFGDVLRDRLRAVGVAESILSFYTSHCMKRGSIQLLRKLGLSDTDIMTRIGMSGERAFLNYVESFNSFHSEPVPRYSNTFAARFNTAVRDQKRREDLRLVRLIERSEIQET